MDLWRFGLTLSAGITGLLVCGANEKSGSIPDTWFTFEVM